MAARMAAEMGKPKAAELGTMMVPWSVDELESHTAAVREKRSDSRMADNLAGSRVCRKVPSMENL